ncbi:hypothetical protein CR513_53136, partial [Mucuna pruriens]
MDPKSARLAQPNRREAVDSLMPWRINSSFDKKVKPCSFKERDLVVKKVLPNSRDQRGKWTPNYEGPYVVKCAFSGGALVLDDAEGQELKHSVNADAIKLLI